MSLTLVVYAPGAGGNHLKNLLCLANSYANNDDLIPEVYESPDPDRPPGEVWCVGGRNLQDIFFDRMTTAPEKSWVLAAHVGEMFQYQTQLNLIANKKIVVIDLEDQQCRRRLDQRQVRLGQCIHPYWLDEELVWMYRSETLAKIFHSHAAQYMQISIKNFWSKHFVNSPEFDQLAAFLNVSVDRVRANRYHDIWHSANCFD